MKKHSAFEDGAIYQTSPDTQPQEKNGIVTLLLVLVILFGGLASLMGLLNIRLLQNADNPPPAASFFVAEGQTLPATRSIEENTDIPLSRLGITTQTVTAFLQSYYDLPQGVYITSVEEGSPAQAAGCLPGDIILQIDGVAVADAEGAVSQVAACQKGAFLTLTLYRAGQTHILQLTLE